MNTLTTFQRWVIAIVLLIIIGGVGFYLYTSFHSQQSSSHFQFTQPQLFFGNALTGPLYGLDISTNNQKPQVATVAGLPGALIDVARGGGKTFYAIESPNKQATNIYFTVDSDAKQVLHEVTFSPTWKYQLSYNAPSNTLAYASILKTATTNASSTTQSTQTTQATISVINTNTNSEKDLGPGSNPVVLPGGSYVLAHTQTTLEVIDSSTGKSTTVLNLASTSPYAVSSDGHTVIAYNPISKTVDSFDISQILSASYLSSKPAGGVVVGLTYAQGKVLVATIPQNTSTTVSIGYLGETKAISSFTAPFGNLVQELNFTYE